MKRPSLQKIGDVVLYKILPVVCLVMTVVVMLGFVALAVYGAFCAVNGCEGAQQ